MEMPTGAASDYLFERGGGGTRPPRLMIRVGVDLIYLVAKLPLMGDDVKGLCCHLHQPTNCG
jgi:hypothetical protein